MSSQTRWIPSLVKKSEPTLFQDASLRVFLMMQSISKLGVLTQWHRSTNRTSCHTRNVSLKRQSHRAHGIVSAELSSTSFPSGCISHCKRCALSLTEYALRPGDTRQSRLSRDAAIKMGLKRRTNTRGLPDRTTQHHSGTFRSIINPRSQTEISIGFQNRWPLSPLECEPELENNPHCQGLDVPKLENRAGQL